MNQLDFLSCDLKMKKQVGKHRPNPKSSEIIGDIMSIRYAAESDVILRGWNIDRRRYVVRKTAVLIEVDYYQAKGDLSVSSYFHKDQ